MCIKLQSSSQVIKTFSKIFHHRNVLRNLTGIHQDARKLRSGIKMVVQWQWKIKRSLIFSFPVWTSFTNKMLTFYLYFSGKESLHNGLKYYGMCCFYLRSNNGTLTHNKLYMSYWHISLSLKKELASEDTPLNKYCGGAQHCRSGCSAAEEQTGITTSSPHS